MFEVWDEMENEMLFNKQPKRSKCLLSKQRGKMKPETVAGDNTKVVFGKWERRKTTFNFPLILPPLVY